VTDHSAEIFLSATIFDQRACSLRISFGMSSELDGDGCAPD
jgi:hypothetical protein